MPLSSIKRAFALLILSSLIALASQNFVIKNDNLLPKKTVDKINEIGNELYQKTGVGVYVAVAEEMDTKRIKPYEERLAKTLTPPYILLTLVRKAQKVDIVASPDAQNLIRKDEILSPLPWKGSIIPLLTAHFKDKKAAIEAAILNGYAEIAEQVAAAKGIKLKSALGNVNRDIYYWLRMLFYSILALIFLNFIYRRFIKK